MPLTLPPALRSLTATLTRLATVTPKEAKVTVGLDIGSSVVKVVALGARKSSGARQILGSQMIPLDDPVDDGRIVAAVTHAVQAARPAVKTVTLSVSGQWVTMRVIEMPAMTPHELRQSLPFEAQRHLPFNIEDVVLDGTILGPSEPQKIWVLIVACKRDLVGRRLGWLQQAGLEPGAVDVDALALVNAFAEGRNGQQTAGSYALLNLGAQWTNLVILKNGIPYLVRDIPWGAARLARQVAEQLGVEEAAVSEQLRQPSAAVSAETLAAMKTCCESVTADLQLSFDFFESRFGNQPERLLVSGGISQCPGFLDALKSHLAQPLIPWEPGEGLSGQFAVAYGLALRTPTS